MKKIDLGQALTILANIGVIAGIVFLAVEIRQNTISQTAASYREISQDFRSISLSSPEEIRAKMRRGEQLSDSESTQYVQWLAVTLRAYESWWKQRELGAIDDETFESYMGHMLVTMRDSQAKDFWLNKDVPYSPGFEEYVSARVFGEMAP